MLKAMRENLKAIACVALLATALTACASEAARPVLSDADFQELANGIESYATYNDTGLTEEAKKVCSAMEGAEPDKSWLSAVKLLTEQGIPAGDAGAFIAVAVSHRCPDMVERLPEQ